MAETSNNDVFYGDYSAIADCLLAIQNQAAAGLYDQDAALQELLRRLESDLLKRLYNRTLLLLAILEGVTDPGLLLQGDFTDNDFLTNDFLTGYAAGSGMSGLFRTVLNIFTVFVYRRAEITDAQSSDIASVFIPVLDAFFELQAYLDAAGLNPCQSAALNYFNNSSAIRLQAVGSDGSGGIAEGVLLRWILDGELGDHHLPQGNYVDANSPTIGFNRPEDYVYLTKTPYTDPLIFTVDLETQQPVINTIAGKWTYAVNINRNGSLYSNLLEVHFSDPVAYLQRLRQVNPANGPLEFIRGYHGLLEFVLPQKTAFRFSLTINKNTTATSTLRLQALEAPDDTGVMAPCLRDVLTLGADALAKTYTNENVKRVQLLLDGTSYPRIFSFETYDDFLTSREEGAWIPVGHGFGLSLDDAAVFQQLEEPGRFTVDHQWPQYRDGTTVRVANYQDKWLNSTDDEPSVRSLVADYLLQSQTDIDAGITLNLSANEDDDGTPFRYVDMINLQATDYHFARMFGLGYIDTAAELRPGIQYIYRMTYTNKPALTAQVATMTALSLPVGKADARLPAKPQIRPVSYQLAAENATPGFYDDQGYNVKSRTRLINIGRAARETEIADNDFWTGDAILAVFDYGVHTSPILYGLEYGMSSGNYVLPYLTDGGLAGRVHYAYNDSYESGQHQLLPETIPLMDNDASLFIQLERKSGIHYYAIYAIDLFARASALSDEVATSETVFPVDNQLKPPTGLTVQYVQQENPLIFTSQREQDWLAGRNNAFPDQDTAFTRLTFDWLDVTDVTALDSSQQDYLNGVLKGKSVNALFKPDELLQVTGLITSVIEVNTATVELITDFYTRIDGSQQVPVIAPADFFRFPGSLLMTPDGQFKVITVAHKSVLGHTFLAITVEKMVETERVDDPSAAPSAISTRTVYQSPLKGSRFSLAENLGAGNNWLPIQSSVQLIDQSNAAEPVIEIVYDQSGGETKLWVGGLHGEATVSPALDASADARPMPGYYQVAFAADVVLAPHPQNIPPYDEAQPAQQSPDVRRPAYAEWYNGKIFLPTLNTTPQKKLLDVVLIRQLSPLVIYAFDPGYLDDDALILSETEPERLLQANYHPGYRAYLMTEPAPDGFNRSQLLPDGNANDKKSLVAVQLSQNQSGQLYNSAISQPAVLMALNIPEPEPPEAPLAANLKVRPDATGQAAFTFDIRISPKNGLRREPFGWSFYRVHHEQLLNSFYIPATVNQILADLASFQQDDFFANRYLGALNLIYEPAGSGHFKKYEITDADGKAATYGFPDPDQPTLFGTADQPAPFGSPVYLLNVERAMHTALMPLTEQIPLLDYIKTGKQTENKVPVIRTVDGALLNPTDPEFDAYPMIRQYPGDDPETYFIRFTDYTLRGSARFLYFYAAAEVTRRLEVGALSGFIGPVTVLHTLPGEAPVIRSFIFGPNTTAGTSPVSVAFKISPFASYDPITHVRIYRSLDSTATRQLGTMDSYLDTDLVVDEQGGILATDDFSDLMTAGKDLPLGDTVYYRLAFIRTIINEQEQSETIVSLGSDVQTVQLVDIINPEAPVLQYDPPSAQLRWFQTTRKGSYYLYQQNSRGNWQLLTTQQAPADASVPMTYTLTPPPVFQDADGNPIYLRFKVRVQNSGGLFNLTDAEKTIGENL